MAEFIHVGEVRDRPLRVEFVNADQILYLSVEVDPERREPVLMLFLAAQNRWMETRGTPDVRATLDRLGVEFDWPEEWG
jgi:hypothetical protein